MENERKLMGDGPVKKMAERDGYVMARRPYCMPFVTTTKAWNKLPDPPPTPEAKAMSEKLTKPQIRELAYLAGRNDGERYSSSYPPIRKLHSLGYVDEDWGKFGGARYSITPAGRRALAQQEARNG